MWRWLRVAVIGSVAAAACFAAPAGATLRKAAPVSIETRRAAAGEARTFALATSGAVAPGSPRSLAVHVVETGAASLSLRRECRHLCRLRGTERLVGSHWRLLLRLDANAEADGSFRGTWTIVDSDGRYLSVRGAGSVTGSLAGSLHYEGKLYTAY